VAEYRVPINLGDTAFDVSRNAKEVAGREVAALLATLHTDAWPAPRAIDPEAGAYHRFPTRRDVRRLAQSGRRVL
jgi:hypothetical protein